MRDLAKELIAMGHSVTILTSGPQFENHAGMQILMDSLTATGVRIQHMDYPKSGSKWGYLRRLPGAAWATYRYLKKEKFDIVHVHTPVLAFIPKIFGFKFVTTIHLAQLKLGICQQKPTHQIAISEEVYKESLQNGLKKENVSLIFNGVDKKYAEDASAETKADLMRRFNILPPPPSQQRADDEVVIGFVGTLCHRKGIDLLLRAGANLYEKGHKRFRIVLLGNYDSASEKETFSRLMKEARGERFLSVVGYQSPEMFYKIFDIFVLPSRLEGFGLVVIEAMLSGCCCVRSNTQGAYDQIDSGKTGYLFENENVEELTETLKFLIENPEKRKEVARAGKEKALAKFTSEVMAKNTLSVYKKVLNEY